MVTKVLQKLLLNRNSHIDRETTLIIALMNDLKNQNFTTPTLNYIPWIIKPIKKNCQMFYPGSHMKDSEQKKKKKWLPIEQILKHCFPVGTFKHTTTKMNEPL